VRSRGNWKGAARKEPLGKRIALEKAPGGGPQKGKDPAFEGKLCSSKVKGPMDFCSGKFDDGGFKTLCPSLRSPDSQTDWG